MEKPTLTILSSKGPGRRAEFGQDNNPLLRLVLIFVRLYDDRIDLDPMYPPIRPSGGDRDEETSSKLNLVNDDTDIKHAPPGSELAHSYYQMPI